MEIGVLNGWFKLLNFFIQVLQIMDDLVQVFFILVYLLIVRKFLGENGSFCLVEKREELRENRVLGMMLFFLAFYFGRGEFQEKSKSRIVGRFLVGGDFLGFSLELCRREKVFVMCRGRYFVILKDLFLQFKGFFLELLF